MFYTYGIHKKQWKIYKKLVIEKGYDNIDLTREHKLNQKQNWFLFTKLLQDKYNHIYKRAMMEKEDIKVGQYVYNLELGNGEIKELLSFNMMIVKFEGKDLGVMCSQDGYTIYDKTKRKISKR